MRLRALFHVKHWLQSKLPYAPILALLCSYAYKTTEGVRISRLSKVFPKKRPSGCSRTAAFLILTDGQPTIARLAKYRSRSMTWRRR